ncbi:DUF4192 domain-containing protein [Luteipulveratus flavus]|uniref:DUF4192 domain-containing protein n=1 Tax=Luteipulveratus flavus TaxID=3031728 RepID=A0ABT6C5K9_9MICO|nr:DUF4192 domain-containing protein [Luteipulveratus sp. YIM 133296]MDF8264228.1 DUF4192 domain-containing protein [Luteipulveratus sp. YIM 133296]
MTHKLRGLGELVAYIPYLLGFVPRASVVVIGSGPDGIGPVSRVDIPPDPKDDEEVARQVVTQLRRASLERFDLIGYAGGRPAHPLLDRISVRLSETTGAEPGHHLLVDDGGWRATRCVCGGCRLGVRSAVPSPDRVPAVAEQVLREVHPYLDRAELVASLQTSRPLVVQAVRSMSRGRPDTLGEVDVAAAWAAVLDVGDDAPAVHDLPAAVLLTAMDALRDPVRRDDILGWLVPGTLSFPAQVPRLVTALDDRLGLPRWRTSLGPQDHEHDTQVIRVTRRLQQLVACTPREWADGTATLLGYWCWVHGQGALATTALEIAVQVRPGRARMAALLLQVISHGLRPEDMRPTPRETAS